MFWESKLDKEGRFRISTRPKRFGGAEWRDHWKQCAYFFGENVECRSGESLSLHCSRDEYSLFFGLGEKYSEEGKEGNEGEGGLFSWWRPRLAMINDDDRTRYYEKSLQSIANGGKEGVCVCYGIAPHFAVLTSKFFEEVHVFEQSLRSMSSFLPRDLPFFLSISNVFIPEI